MNGLTDITLYHGSASPDVTPTFGFGDGRHDYGKGFYLTADEQLSLGDLGIQYCLKSRRAFEAAEELPGSPLPVDFAEYNARYNERDAAARANMERLVNGPANPAERVLSVLLQEGR